MNWTSGLRYSRFCARAIRPAEIPTAAVAASNRLRVVVNIKQRKQIT
jgi:hypothetical protein